MLLLKTDHVFHIQMKNVLFEYGKIKAGIFHDPKIKQIIKDPPFVNSRREAEQKAALHFLQL